MVTNRTSWLAAALLFSWVTAPGATGNQVTVVQGSTAEIRVEGITGDFQSPLGGRGLQPMGIGSGLIIGRAFEATSGQTIPGALVTLGLPGVAPLRVLADAEGRFAFRTLPVGRYSLTASKPGFVEGAYGRRRPAGPTQAIDLTEGQRALDANVPLWRYSALAGTVVDEQGEPVVGATVQALLRTTVAGMPKLTSAALDQTDDRGMYRIGMLVPGDYVVVLPVGRPGMQTFTFSPPGGGYAVAQIATFTAAVAGGGIAEGPDGVPVPITNTETLMSPAGLAPDGTPLTYATVFYPTSVGPARAASVRLGSGEERTGLDFERRPVPSATVSGLVSGPDGPAPNQTVTLVPAGSDDLVSPVGNYTTRTGADGRYAFSHVAPGGYTLRVVQTPGAAMGVRDQTVTGGGGVMMVRTVLTGRGAAAPPLPDEPTLWAEVPVNVAGVIEVPVALRAGARITGQVAFTGAAERPASDQLPSIRVTLDPADGRTQAMQLNLRGRIETTGQFRTMSVPPGNYFVRVEGAPQGWHFRGATLGGRNVTDEPLTIEGEDIGGVTLSFTDQQTQITGSVTSDNDQEDTSALVVAFPTDRAGWINYGSRPRRVQSTRVSGNGSFTLSGLPPGDYLVAAVRDEIAGDWQRTEFLESIATSATRVRLAEGDKQTHSLRVVR
ncbi:MAG TPA: carboxypeptidase regulatory-like domain-containing protein [Vicinamibacterales bacterium]|nr:carboxypeptidase regulatory-like domain-containing protein [Vicinamibacterales bacterium]